MLAAIASDLRKHYAKDYRIVRAASAPRRSTRSRTLKERGRAGGAAPVGSAHAGLDGVGFLAQAKELFPAAKRALLTAYADTDAAIAAINESQVDYYLQKPWDPPEQQLYPDRRRPARGLARGVPARLWRREGDRQPLDAVGAPDQGVPRP